MLAKDKREEKVGQSGILDLGREKKSKKDRQESGTHEKEVRRERSGQGKKKMILPWPVIKTLCGVQRAQRVGKPVAGRR